MGAKSVTWLFIRHKSANVFGASGSRPVTDSASPQNWSHDPFCLAWNFSSGHAPCSIQNEQQKDTQKAIRVDKEGLKKRPEEDLHWAELFAQETLWWPVDGGKMWCWWKHFSNDSNECLPRVLSQPKVTRAWQDNHKPFVFHFDVLLPPTWQIQNK